MISTDIRVLHVDDDAAFAEMAAEFLRSETLVVTTVESAAEAREFLSAHESEVDCVVSDYDMPGETGLDLLDDVRTAYPDLPFVLFTGKGSEEIASEAIAGGVTDYLRKAGGSDTFAILANRIENAVESRRAREAAARNRRLLEKVVEHATEIIATVDTRGRIVFISGSVEAILGYSPDEVGEMDAFDLVHPDDRDQLREQFSTRLRHPDTPTGISHRALHSDGSVVDVEARAYNLVDDLDVEGILIYSRPRSADEVTHERD